MRFQAARYRTRKRTYPIFVHERDKVGFREVVGFRRLPISDLANGRFELFAFFESRDCVGIPFLVDIDNEVVLFLDHQTYVNR